MNIRIQLLCVVFVIAAIAGAITFAALRGDHQDNVSAAVPTATPGTQRNLYEQLY